MAAPLREGGPLVTGAAGLRGGGRAGFPTGDACAAGAVVIPRDWGIVPAMNARTLLVPVVCLMGAAVAARAQTPAYPGITVTPYTTGLSAPTQMRFIGPDDFLITEKDTGLVKRVVNGGPAETVLSLPVSSAGERGLLGIAPAPDFATALEKHVYVYYSAIDTAGGGGWLENRLSRFTWDGTSLGGEVRIASFGTAEDGPVSGTTHNGGPLTFGADGMLYGVTGDLNRSGLEQNNTAVGTGSAFTGGIFRLDPATGQPPADNPFADHPDPALRQWYAYGVRNSFGIAVDPVTGELWDTENGPNLNDEINRVEPGMNSGWTTIMGPDTDGQAASLVSLGAAATYSDPEFTIRNPVGITAIQFGAGSALGSSYQDKVFVADINNGNIYMLPLNADRTGFDLSGNLADLVADTVAERNELLFGSGFGPVTDIQVGPDGALYVTSYGTGTVYRVVPEPSALLLCGLSAAVALRRRRLP